jgi:signal transduction protein with GAF and PtsI domain
VPLVDRGLSVGVLLVQTIESRPFSADEVLMVATATAQLSPVVSDPADQNVRLIPSVGPATPNRVLENWQKA